MSGMEILAGMAVAWLWRKLKHSAGKLDASVDEVTDAVLTRLTAAVKAKLAGDTALRKLEQQAESETEVSTTRQRVELAVQEAAEEDEEFAARLKQLLDELRDADPQGARIAGRDYYEITGDNAQVTIHNR